MRITGGKFRGRRVLCPPGVIRPAMDRMRESVFGTLGDITGKGFLDLFSGSGVVGIEAASRGASPVVLVERDRRKRTVLMRNIDMVDTEITPRFMAAEQYVRTARHGFGLVFLDPPFAYRHRQHLLEEVERSRLLEDGTIILVHHPREEQLPDMIGILEKYDERRYGQSVVAFYSVSAGLGGG